jgi:hypothetical protein
LQTGRDLRLSGSVRQCQEPPFWLIRSIRFIGRSLRALLSGRTAIDEVLHLLL